MQVEYRGYTSRRRFGVEMELDPNVSKWEISDMLLNYENQYGSFRQIRVEDGGSGWAESKGNDFWHVKFDSSCGPTGHRRDGGGWEIASYVGETPQNLDSIADAAHYLSLGGAQVNNHCGLHIHAEVEDFTVSRMGILLARWAKIEPILMQACPQRRRRNRHCKPLRRKLNPYLEYTPKGFYYGMAPVNLRSWENNDKRYTINIVGFARGIATEDYSRTTAELRLPEGTLEADEIRAWGTLFVHFVDTCSKIGTMPDHVLPADLNGTMEILGLAGEEKLLILDRRLHATKTWLLGRLLAHATRPGLATDAQRMLDFIAKI